MPKIVIESHIPYVGNAFAGVADTTFLPPERITPEAVRDADALIVRTRTRCDAALLDGSRVRFVATATIGTDHIDLGYCRDNGIEVVSAPGCNAPAVAQYVWASVFTLRRDDWQGLTLGIVGLGHVGSIVADWARRLGVKVLACDPPRQRRDGGWNPAEPFASGSEPFVTLSDIAEKCDIITIHTPHTKTGRDATHHLADRHFFSSLKRKPVFINAARGPIVDTEAVLSAISARQLSACVIDCWEGEPAINRDLLRLADIATPHIAGYSVEGKRRATAAVVSAALRHFFHNGSPESVSPAAECQVIGQYDQNTVLTPGSILTSYNPLVDSDLLKSTFNPAVFEQLRNNYPLRHELGFTDAVPLK